MRHLVPRRLSLRNFNKKFSHSYTDIPFYPLFAFFQLSLTSFGFLGRRLSIVRYVDHRPAYRMIGGERRGSRNFAPDTIKSVRKIIIKVLWNYPQMHWFYYHIRVIGARTAWSTTLPLFTSIGIPVYSSEFASWRVRAGPDKYGGGKTAIPFPLQMKFVTRPELVDMKLNPCNYHYV